MEEAAVPSRRVTVGLVLFAVALRLPTLALRRLVEGDGVHYAQLARFDPGRGLVRARQPLLVEPLAGGHRRHERDYRPRRRGLGTASTSLVSGVLLVPVTATLATRIVGPTSGFVAGACSPPSIPG